MGAEIGTSLRHTVSSSAPAAAIADDRTPAAGPASAPRSCADLALHSVFQPVISVAHSKVVGHEALLRGHDGQGRPMSAAQVLPHLGERMTPQKVNETCARLHLESFSLQCRQGWLFLNANPEAVPDRRTVAREFGALLDDFGVRPESVVVEIVETRCYDERRLQNAVCGFRDVGCLVAIDDFGAGESNFERIWRLRPDIVKLDRTMLTEATENPLVHRILPGLVSLLHEAGCLVVMEGIETARQALIALESDTDFVQGFYFSEPTPDNPHQERIRHQFIELMEQMKSERHAQSASDHGFFMGFVAGLEGCVSALEEGAEFFDACSMFLAVAGVQRVYLLDEEGYQVGSNAESDNVSSADPRFYPCRDGTGANWYRRPYFQRAVREPGRTQISRPYLSVRDARTCVTMSHSFETPRGLQVLCADLDYEQAEPLSRRNPLESGIMKR